MQKHTESQDFWDWQKELIDEARKTIAEREDKPLEAVTWDEIMGELLD